MYKFVKCFFLTICIFSTLGVILHLYFIVNGNVYGKINLVSSSSLSILKYEESSNLSPIKTARKDKVFTLGKGTSKKTVKTKQEKENIASSFVIKSQQMNISLSIKSNDNLQENRKFLAVLATSWLPEEEKTHVHENVARVWGSWPEIVQPVVYTNLSLIDKSFDQCIKSGWKLLPIRKTKCQGIPVLNDMVMNILKKFPKSEFYGFVNSDILFDPGLIETFNFVKSQTRDRPVLLIGQRTNVNFTERMDVHSPKEVLKLAEKGKIMRAYAIDYFLTDRSFPWDKFPDLVIGRHQYDNYFVHFSLMQNVSVIDVTETVKAIHQTTKDGNNSGNHRHHKNCNKQMIKNMGKPFYASWGFVTCAQKYTHRNKSGNISISYRNPWKYCMPSPPKNKES